MKTNRNLTFLFLLTAFIVGCNDNKKEEAINFKLGQFYVEQGNDKLALQILMPETKSGKNMLEAHRLIGGVYYKVGYFNDAESHLMSAIQLGCRQACSETLIDVYLKQNKIALAEKEFSENITDKNREQYQTNCSTKNAPIPEDLIFNPIFLDTIHISPGIFFGSYNSGYSIKM